MSFLYFGNVPSSVPKVLDTTPCMKQMLEYEDCVQDGKIAQQEVIHPSWPTVFPRLQTDGSLLVNQYYLGFGQKQTNYMKKLSKQDKQYLWECESERFVYKACMREVIKLKRTEKHTSWETAEVANLQLT